MTNDNFEEKRKEQKVIAPYRRSGEVIRLTIIAAIVILIATKLAGVW